MFVVAAIVVILLLDFNPTSFDYHRLSGVQGDPTLLNSSKIIERAHSFDAAGYAEKRYIIQFYTVFEPMIAPSVAYSRMRPYATLGGFQTYSTKHAKKTKKKLGK